MRNITWIALALAAACRSGADKGGETGLLEPAGDGGAATTDDADGDGYASADAGGDDCDDGDPDVNPGASEVPYDGLDNDCDASTPDDDLDGDGYGAVEAGGEDCDDADAGVHPDAVEVCNGADDDCDGVIDDNAGDVWYLDADGDGYGDAEVSSQDCEQPGRYVDNAEDCDDTDAGVYPGAEEACNEVDDDCDGDVDEGVKTTYYADVDGDGWGDAASTTEDCALPTGYAEEAGDCDDLDPTAWPGADETCDGVDDDCDGDVDEDAVDAPTWYADADGDGYGDPASAAAACEAPTGFVADDSDCDDGDASVNPDTTWYVDADGDGWPASSPSVTSCEAPTGFVAATSAWDCDDADASANPGESEVCDEVDNDCDGDVDEGVTSTFYADRDGDGYGDAATSVEACSAPTSLYVSDDTDCDDLDAASHPGASETCDGADNDCDGDVDEGLLGTAAACPAESCAAVLADDPSAADGSYYLDPTGTGDVAAWTCDMSTDGGGWTLIVDWDAENDGDTIDDFEAAFSESYNDMTDWTDKGTYIRWSDYNASADVMAYTVPVDVPNGGEAMLDVHLYGYSYEDSATFFSGEVAGSQEEILCAAYMDWSSSGISAWSSAEQAYWPSYTCSTYVSGSSGNTFTWNGTWTATLSGEIEAFDLTSFHYDSGYGDYTRLYSLAFWVR